MFSLRGTKTLLIGNQGIIAAFKNVILSSHVGTSHEILPFFIYHFLANKRKVKRQDYTIAREFNLQHKKVLTAHITFRYAKEKPPLR